MADLLERLRKVSNRHIEIQAIKIKTTHILLMISKYHSPMIGTETLREMAKKGKLYKMRLEDSVVPESRKVLKKHKHGIMSKGCGSQLERTPNDRSWNNLSKKTNNPVYDIILSTK